MRRYLPVLLCLLGFLSWGQYSPTETHEAISDLSIVEKVDYINTNFYSIYSADFHNSLALTREAVHLTKENRWPAREALAQKNYGIILYLTGDYENALPAYLRSYDLYDSLQDKSGLAQVSNEMANYYQKQGANQKALDLWTQSEKLATEANDIRTLGTSLGMQAAFYWTRGDYEKADPLYLRCYEIRKEQNDSVGLGYILLDLADIERRKGNLKKALAHFETSTQIRQNIGDHQGVLENYKALGDLFYNEGQLDDAINQYKKAANESVRFGYPDLTRKAYDSLSSVYAQKKDFERSLQLKIKAENLEDSLFNLERSKTIEELQTRYETEKKEQQIGLQAAELAEQEATISRNRIALISAIGALIFLIAIGTLWRNKVRKKQQLRLQETQLQAREAEITATISSQEKERARYARDLHDGFGQMISILNMNLQSLGNDTRPDERQKIFDASRQVIDEMYGELKNICFDLMPQTLIKHGLESGLKEFADRINQAGKITIELNVFGMEGRLTEIQEISLYRISQEWVNNIIKYSNAEKVVLQITKDEAEITLLIEDNGNGFDKILLINGKGNGWKNLNTRTNLIKGKLELETEEGKKGNVLIMNAPLKINSFENQPIIDQKASILKG